MQYIIVSAAYQVEGDAIQYAARNDLSIKNLQVKLSGAGNVYTAIEMDSVAIDTDGIFFPYRTLYAFNTNGKTGNPVLIAGEFYTLEIGSQDTGMYVTATTIIPKGAGLDNTKFAPFSCGGNLSCLREFDLTKDMPVLFKKGTDAAAFEIKVTLDYFADGDSATAGWGPTDLIEGNVRCPAGSAQLCYQINENSLIASFQNQMESAGTVFTYDAQPAQHTTKDSLTNSFRIELTAVDINLRNYMLANNPKVTDLTGAKPEWTNVAGNLRTVGVFGSYIADRENIAMNECSEFLLNLNGTPDPGVTCIKIE